VSAPGPVDGLGDAASPGTGEVTATVIVNAPAPRVFAAFTNWERQSEWMPFTKVRVVEGDGGEGSLVEAVTGVGAAGLRDEMRVVRVDAPYEVRVVHCGKVLRGPGSMRCTAMGGDRTQVVMHEWFHLPAGAVGRLAWPVIWPGSKLSLKGALKKFGRLVEQGRLS
jgi:uncharacterized membrane protein